MSILRRGRRPEERAAFPVMPWTEWVGSLGVGGYAAGTVDLALRNAASWACIRVLASSVAGTPLDCVRVEGETRIPIDWQFLSKPSGLVAPDVWRFQLAYSLVTDGNAFGKIVGRDAAGYPSQVEILDPSAVGQRGVVDGIPQVVVDGAQASRLWPFGDVWHVPGAMVPAGSVFGVSPIRQAAKTIGTSLSVEDFSHRYFADGGHPTFAFMLDSNPSPDEAESIKQTIMRRMAPGSREPLLLGSGIEPKPLQVPPNETQFIDLARFELEQACRFWGVPPSMIYAATSGQNVTYANVTQADLHYLKHSLDVYLVRVEQALSTVVPANVTVKANRNAMLRADVAARYASYQVALANRFMTVNEVRALEDLRPFEGVEYDEPGVPPHTIDLTGGPTDGTD